MINPVNITIFLVVVAFIFTWFQVFKMYKRINEQQREAEESVDSNFKDLQKKIEKQIEMIDGEPGFNEEERKIRDRLREALNKSESDIKKNLEKEE